MIRLSSGLRASMLWTWGLNALLEGGHIRVYSGPQPATADAPPSGQLLGYISTDGLLPQPGQPPGGLHFTLESRAVLVNHGTWILTGTATGEAGWWRLVWNAPDPGTHSDYYPRIDGTVGESFRLADTLITPATRTPVTRFQIVFPFSTTELTP